MHSRSLQNSVLFTQHRQHGFKCTWTGLNDMAVHELLTVCTSSEDVERFQDGYALFFQDENIYCHEYLASYLLQRACPKLPLNDVNDKKCQLLFGLFKEHGIETFTRRPSIKEVIEEMINICANKCDVKEVARNVLVKIAEFHEVEDANDAHLAVILHLTEHRGADLNSLEKFDFEELMRSLHNILLYLCAVFSTPTTNVFLHTKLDAEKIDHLWKSVLEYLPANLFFEGAVDLIHSFIRNGFDVKDALYRVDFDDFFSSHCNTPECFNVLLELLEIFMDHGARLNPSHSNVQHFLIGLLERYSSVYYDAETRPSLYGFISMCIERGADPRTSYTTWVMGGMRGTTYEGANYEDLLLAVWRNYDADDKKELIGHLCDCGADASLYRNNGADIWLKLSRLSKKRLTRPCFNEALLTLLNKGLQTNCIDEDGNNVLHMFILMYSEKSILHDILRDDSLTVFKAKGCCRYGWFRALDELKFWDVLDALLDAGVPVSRVNNDGEIPLHAFKRMMPPGFETVLETVCSECCQRYTDVDMAVIPNAQLTRVAEYKTRLSHRSSQ